MTCLAHLFPHSLTLCMSVFVVAMSCDGEVHITCLLNLILTLACMLTAEYTCSSTRVLTSELTQVKTWMPPVYLATPLQSRHQCLTTSLDYMTTNFLAIQMLPSLPLIDSSPLFPAVANICQHQIFIVRKHSLGKDSPKLSRAAAHDSR